MPTYYTPIIGFLFSDLFDGSLDQFNIHEQYTKYTSRTFRCLNDGDDNYVWVLGGPCGGVEVFVRYGTNWADKVINTVSGLFDTNFSSRRSHHHEFEFITEEEWDAALDEEPWSKWAPRESPYLEPNDATLAIVTVDIDDEVFHLDDAVTVTLTPDLDLAKIIASKGSNLPPTPATKPKRR